MLLENGMYLGSTKWFSLKLIKPDGSAVVVDTTRLTLKIIRPDGSVYATYTSGFTTESDNSVLRAVTIDASQPKGYWRALWNYTEPDGKTWVEETFFVVSEV